MTDAERIAQLEAALKKAQTKVTHQAQRIRYLEGATNHATGTPLSQALAQLAEARRERDEALRGRDAMRHYHGVATAGQEMAENEVESLRAQLAAVEAGAVERCAKVAEGLAAHACEMNNCCGSSDIAREIRALSTAVGQESLEAIRELMKAADQVTSVMVKTPDGLSGAEFAAMIAVRDALAAPALRRFVGEGETSRAALGRQESDARAARDELARRELEDAIERSQREGWCLAVNEECLTHDCAPAWPCGRLTCPHCRGDRGDGPNY